MSVSKYRELIDQLCALTLLPNPEAYYENAALAVGGVDFSLLYSEAEDAGNILIFCDAGSLPGKQQLEIVLRLLELNLQLYTGPNSPTFAYNANTQRITLATALPVLRTDAQALLTLLTDLADMAQVWRKDFFLMPAARRQESQATRLQANPLQSPLPASRPRA